MNATKTDQLPAKALSRPKSGKGKKIGRPRQEFDLKLVEKLAKLACTAEEIAAFLDTSASTVSRRISEDESEFCKVYKRGLAEAKRSLRRKQLEVAMKGNATMLIFLGKNLLGQADKVESKAEVNDTRMTIAEIIDSIPPVEGDFAVKFPSESQQSCGDGR